MTDGLWMAVAMAKAGVPFVEQRPAAVDRVRKILAAHDPNMPNLKETAERVTSQAQRYRRVPDELAAELVARLKEPIEIPEGLSAGIGFSRQRRTYVWNVWKDTRQRRRDNARRMQADARRRSAR